jgi:hypothetical protein
VFQCVNVGYDYQQGLGVAQDYSTAAVFYGKACDDKSREGAEGCADLGWLLEMGFGVTKDEVKSLGLYKLACGLGAKLGCNNLGVMYRDGRGGIAKDYAASAKLFKQACDMGDIAGCANLGYMLANAQGVLFMDEAKKATEFIQLANQADTPLIFLQNTTGYMVGKDYEQAGIIKDGAKMINAVTNSTVPHLTVMIGASYGAGNYGMSGRAYDPRFVFSWPSHKIAVMGPTQLAGVMAIVGRASAESAGRQWDEAEGERLRRSVEEQIDRESSVLFATARIWDDGIVDPRDTRTVLGIALSACDSAEVRGTSGFGVFRM